MKYKRVDKLADGTWIVKDREFVTVKRAQFLEDKLEVLRLILNQYLEASDLKDLIQDDGIGGDKDES